VELIDEKLIIVRKGEDLNAKVREEVCNGEIKTLGLIEMKMESSGEDG